MKQKIFEMEKEYMAQWEEGSRIRKNPQQVKILRKNFEENPTWNRSKQFQIAVEIGMTINQVAKWNWDQRKKLKTQAERKKKR